MAITPQEPHDVTIAIFQGVRCSSISDKMVSATIDSVGHDTPINAWVMKTHLNWVICIQFFTVGTLEWSKKKTDEDSNYANIFLRARSLKSRSVGAHTYLDLLKEMHSSFDKLMVTKHSFEVVEMLPLSGFSNGLVEQRVNDIYYVGIPQWSRSSP